MNTPKASQNSLFNSPNSKNTQSLPGSESVTNTVSSIKNSVTKSIQDMGSKPETIIGLIVLILFAGIVALLMYNFVTKTVFNQSKLVISETKMPLLCNKINKLSLDYELKSGNGKKRTYTFWIYIKDMAHKYFKNVLYIGNENTLKGRSPQIFMDKQKNKLFIRFNKDQNQTGDGETYLDSYSGIGTAGSSIDEEFGESTAYSDAFKRYMKQGVCIEYVPIQRWVHIGIVVNDYGNNQGGSIATYVDGDLVGLANQGEKMRGYGDVTEEHTYDINNLELEKNDDLIIGGEHNTDTTPGFAGLLCKFTMFNYDLNDRDIHNDYNEGPIDNIMAKLGLGAYGVRSPIYKIQ